MSEVQRAGGFSRGALLHHFPTREAMPGATIRSLMERNEAAVRQAEAAVPADLDRIDRAIRVLCASNTGEDPADRSHRRLHGRLTPRGTCPSTMEDQTPVAGLARVIFRVFRVFFHLNGLTS